MAGWVSDWKTKTRPSQTAILTIQRHPQSLPFFSFQLPIANALSSQVSCFCVFPGVNVVLVLIGAWWVCVFCEIFNVFSLVAFGPQLCWGVLLEHSGVTHSGDHAAYGHLWAGQSHEEWQDENIDVIVSWAQQSFLSIFSFFFFKVVNFDPLSPFSKHQR